VIPVVPPEQSVSVEGEAVATGTGFTVMVTDGTAAVQPAPVVATTEYVTVPEVVPVVVNVCEMLVPEPAAAPLIPVDEDTVQLNVVPATLLVRGMFVVAPEQMVAGSGVAVMTGLGFTVITIVTGVPGQEFAVGVTVYVAVPVAVPELVSVCAMLVPEPALPPVTVPEYVGVVQANVVPETVPDKLIPVVVPEQMDCEAGVGVTFGTGLTVTTTVKVLPTQLAAVGVTVYVAVPTVVPLLVSVCAIVDPDPALPPLTEPV